MERTYLAFMHKDPDSSFGVTFPDLPGCTSGGSTFEETREMAREALALHLEGMAADGEHIPPPCSPDAALAHEDAGYAIALIAVKALPERTEEEAQAELEAFLASDEYQEIYGTPLTEEELHNLYNSPEESGQSAISLKPVPDTSAARTYAALVRQTSDDGFSISFPDLPGCTAAGGALEDACEVAREALALHLEGLVMRGEPVAAPGPANLIWDHVNAADAGALIVVEAVSGRKGDEERSAFEVVATST